MILYVDETENEKYFIVAGLLLSSSSLANIVYSRFKNDIKGYKISRKLKSKIYNEFKSKYLDSMLQKAKSKMLEEISSVECSIYYYVYPKRNNAFKQSNKEEVYIYLLDRMVKDIGCHIEIVFDKFSKAQFEERIIKTIKENKNVLSITPADSQKIAGIQLIDNVCSTIRQKISDKDRYNFYSMIENHIKRSKLVDNILK